MNNTFPLPTAPCDPTNATCTVNTTSIANSAAALVNTTVSAGSIPGGSTLTGLTVLQAAATYFQYSQNWAGGSTGVQPY